MHVLPFFFISVQMYKTYVCKSLMWLLSPVLDGVVCVKFMDVCLILCHCNILLHPSVGCLEHLFSPHVCFLMWMGLYVYLCVWSVRGHMFTIENNIVWCSVAWFLFCGFTKPANMHLCWMPVTLSPISVNDLSVLFCFCSPLYPVLPLTILLFLFSHTFVSTSNSPMYIFVSPSPHLTS